MLPGSADRASARALLGCLAVLLLVVALAGCGPARRAGQPTGPSEDALDCRAQWQALGDSLKGRDEQADPSDLADRWNSVIATAQYYAQGASAQDCLTALSDQKDAIGRIDRLSTQLRPFDIAYRMSALAPTATDYLAAARPTARKVDGRLQRPPTKRVVRRALATLQTQAALSVTDMQDGWHEAQTVNLADQPAVKRTVADLRFLAGDSAPFQQCLAALDVLRKASLFHLGQ